MRAVPVPSAFARAVHQETRTVSGAPGPRYWQQYARYSLHASLDAPGAALLGRGVMRYENHSPDTLRVLAVHLYQNLFAAGARTNTDVPVTGGLTVLSISAQGRALFLSADSAVDGREDARVEGTTAWLRLPRPLDPGANVDVEIAWRFRIPPAGAPRMGQDGDVFFLGQWYPQFAVYDDLTGWHTDPYLGNAEFHTGFADYDVTLDVPAGWLVAATGTLRNADAVLTAPVRARLALARASDSVVRVVALRQRGAGKATSRGTDRRLLWRWTASGVRDFAWGTSERWLWDATRALVPQAGGSVDTVSINALYRPAIAGWRSSASDQRHAVELLSRLAWPYPYAAMTAVEGPIAGGMEYPMLTLIRAEGDRHRLYSVTAHEVAHMWLPMQVATDEKRYPWMDEGLAEYHETLAYASRFPGESREDKVRRAYLRDAGSSREAELMHHGDAYPAGSHAYVISAYYKPALVLRALRGVVGDSAFLRAVRTFGAEWRGKHPHPLDFFHTVERISGRDLGWFWTSWFYGTGTLDQVIAEVRPTGDSARIVVEDRGRIPMPVRLAITRAGGIVERIEVPVDAWLRGDRVVTVSVASVPAITRIEIDPEQIFPDRVRRNGEWTP